MAFKVKLTDLAVEELKAIRTFYQRRIKSAIEKQLKHQPTDTARNRKQLDTIVPDFEYDPPIWELRVGEYRIFYDVNFSNSTVTIRAIRRKEPDQTTEDIVT